jgi:glutaredoxin/predicted small lipoprotein YifL
MLGRIHALVLPLALTLVLPVTLGSALAGCGQKGASDKPPKPAVETPLPPIEITRERPLVFSFREGKGFKTVQSMDEIPAEARGWVRVQDPSQPAIPGERVYVADLRKPDEKGRFPYKVLERSVFASGRALPEGSMGAPDATSRDSVVLYSRPACSACDSAREYLKQQGIPFVEKNVQADPAAARELAEKARKKGVPSNMVPVLDVNGELIVGLDTQKLDRLLRRQI